MNENKPRELLGWRMYGYAFGNFGLMLVGMITGSYSIIYYTYVVNIDFGYASIGSSIAMLTMAFSSIIFGVLLDNKKPGKLGKRRPFILLGLPLWVLTTILIWLPPDKPPESLGTVIHWPAILWLWGLSFIRALSRSLIMISLSSMLPEQSQTLKNREDLAYLQTKLMIISSVFSVGIPMVLSSLIDIDTSQHWTADGEFAFIFIFTASLILTILGSIFLVTSFFAVDETFHKHLKFEKKSYSEAFIQIIRPFKDKEYRKYLGMRVFNSVGGRLVGISVIPLVGFVLGRGKTEAQASFLFLYYPIVSVTSKFLWLWIWRSIHKKTGSDVFKTYKWCMGVYVLSAAAEIVFFWEYSYELTLFLFYVTFGTMLGAMYAQNMFGPPILNAIVDEAAVKISLEESTQNNEVMKDQVVTRISGSYYGLINFSFSIGSAITSVIVGFVLSGNERNPFVINAVFCSMTVFYFFSWLLLRTIKVKLE